MTGQAGHLQSVNGAVMLQCDRTCIRMRNQFESVRIATGRSIMEL